MLVVRLAGDHLYGNEIAVHLALAGDVFVLSYFRLDVLDEIWDLIQSVS